MNPDDAKKWFESFKKKYDRFNLSNFLFDKQFDFVNDDHPFKTAVCSRRAGKTTACGGHLIDTAFNNPGTVALYITLSRSNAKKIIWPELQKINRLYDLGGKVDNTELTIKFPNDSIIYISGANDKSEIDKFRGLPIKLCYIDECQSFKEYIQELVDDVIAPALMDYAGSLCLIGTPRPVPSGYFWNCVESPKWSHHAWTFKDNPYLPLKSGLTHEQILNRELERLGVTADHPSIKREWFGQWELDTEHLILHYSPHLNHYEHLPLGSWDYIMGIDVGFEDADAIAVLAWSEAHAATYLVEELVVHKQGFTELVSQIEAIQKKYNVSKMMIDEGGLGKKLAEEIRRRHHIPVQPADKLRKMESYSFLNDALLTSRFKAKETSRFAQDAFLLEIDRDKTTPEKIKVKDSFHSDIIDAVLYAFKESPAFTYQVPKVIPKHGTPEWYQNEVTEMEEREIQYLKDQADATKAFGGWEL